eukprot:scaffold38713_cov73-Phaeocystis_antarctica.AAC.2
MPLDLTQATAHISAHISSSLLVLVLLLLVLVLVLVLAEVHPSRVIGVGHQVVVVIAVLTVGRVVMRVAPVAGSKHSRPQPTGLQVPDLVLVQKVRHVAVLLHVRARVDDEEPARSHPDGVLRLRR